jgi:hypothetical protein
MNELKKFVEEKGLQMNIASLSGDTALLSGCWITGCPETTCPGSGGACSNIAYCGGSICDTGACKDNAGTCGAGYATCGVNKACTNR